MPLIEVEDFHQSDDENQDISEFEEKFLLLRKKRQAQEIEANYHSDTSDEDNTVGNIPMEWYDEYDHIGYDLDGNKIAKPIGTSKDEMDKFLSSMDDSQWKSVYDKYKGKDITLNKEELEMLKRIQAHQFPETAYDPYEVTIIR